MFSSKASDFGVWAFVVVKYASQDRVGKRFGLGGIGRLLKGTNHMLIRSCESRTVGERFE